MELDDLPWRAAGVLGSGAARWVLTDFHGGGSRAMARRRRRRLRVLGHGGGGEGGAGGARCVRSPPFPSTSARDPSAMDATWEFHRATMEVHRASVTGHHGQPWELHRRQRAAAPPPAATAMGAPARPALLRTPARPPGARRMVATPATAMTTEVPAVHRRCSTNCFYGGKLT